MGTSSILSNFRVAVKYHVINRVAYKPCITWVNPKTLKIRANCSANAPFKDSPALRQGIFPKHPFTFNLPLLQQYPILLLKRLLKLSLPLLKNSLLPPQRFHLRPEIKESKQKPNKNTHNNNHDEIQHHPSPNFKHFPHNIFNLLSSPCSKTTVFC